MEHELGTLIALVTASPAVTVTEVARSRIREKSGVFRGGQRPPKPANSREFGYSPSKAEGDCVQRQAALHSNATQSPSACR